MAGSSSLLKLLMKSAPRMGDSLVTKIGKRLISPITKPLRGITKLFSKRARNISAAVKRGRSMEKAALKRKLGRFGYFRKSVGNFLKAGVALAAAPLVLYGLRRVFGNANNPTKPLNNLGDYNGNSPNPGGLTEEGLNKVNAANQRALDNLSKEQRARARDDTKSKLAEARAEMFATEKLISKLKPSHTHVPDRLTKIYAKQQTTDARLDAIIELLNRQNEISNETKVLSRTQVEQQQEEIKARLTKSSELYRNLMKLHVQQSSANADALNNLNKTLSTGNRANVNAISNVGSKISAANKSSSLLKWLFLGGIMYGIYNLIKRLSGVGELISHGVEIVKDGLINIGDFLGVINKSQLDIAEANAAVENGAPSEKDKDPSERSESFNNNQVEGAKSLSAAVSQKTLDDISNEDGSIDGKKAADRGLHKTYDGTFEKKVGRMALAGHGILGAIQGLQWGKNKAKDAKAVKNIMKETGFSKAEAKYYHNSEKALEAEKEAKALKEAKAAKNASKGGSWISKLWSKTKDVAGAVGRGVYKYTRAKLIVEKTKKIWEAGMKVVSKATWSVLGKIVGPRNLKLIKGFISNVGKLAVKNAGKAGAKFIPGVGLAIGIVDAAIRGFKDGDWLGATLSFVSGLASTFPGIGTAASVLIDGISLGRDVYLASNQEKESKDATELLRKLQETGRYRPGDDSNIYSAIMKAFGDTSDDMHKDKRKTELLRAICDLGEKARKENYKGTEREYQEANKLLQDAGLKLKYNENGILQSFAKGGIVKAQELVNKNNYQNVLVGDGSLFGKAPGSELIVEPKSKGGKISLSDNKPEVRSVPTGTLIFDADKTKKILNNKANVIDLAKKYKASPDVLATIKSKNVLSTITNPQHTDGRGDSDDTNYLEKPGPKLGGFVPLTNVFNNWLNKHGYATQSNQSEDSSQSGGGGYRAGIKDSTNYSGSEVNFDSIPDANPSTNEFDIVTAVSKLRSIVNSRPTGWCARHVRTAIQAGLHDSLSDRPNSAKDYRLYLPKKGFQKLRFEGYKPLPGDVFVEPHVPGGSTHGHITMFDGSNWLSDFIQRDMWGGGSYRRAKKGTLFRHTKPTEKSKVEFNIADSDIKKDYGGILDEIDLSTEGASSSAIKLANDSLVKNFQAQVKSNKGNGVKVEQSKTDDRPRLIFNKGTKSDIPIALTQTGKDKYQFRFSLGNGNQIYNGNGFTEGSTWTDDKGKEYDSTRMVNFILSLLSDSKGKDRFKGSARTRGKYNIYRFGEREVLVPKDGTKFNSHKTKLKVTDLNGYSGTSIKGTGDMYFYQVLNAITNRPEVYEKGFTLDKKYKEQKEKEAKNGVTVQMALCGDSWTADSSGNPANLGKAWLDNKCGEVKGLSGAGIHDVAKFVAQMSTKYDHIVVHAGINNYHQTEASIVSNVRALVRSANGKTIYWVLPLSCSKSKCNRVFSKIPIVRKAISSCASNQLKIIDTSPYDQLFPDNSYAKDGFHLSSQQEYNKLFNIIINELNKLGVKPGGVSKSVNNTVSDEEAGTASGDKEKVIAYAMDRFVKAGLTPEQAAGIVGNLMNEGLLTSNYTRAAAYNDVGKHSFGIAGFRGDPARGQKGAGDWINLDNYTKAKGINIDTLGGQLDYLTHLFKDNVTGYGSNRPVISGNRQNGGVGFMDAIKGLDTDDVVRSWVSKYEKCRNNTIDTSKEVKPRFSHARLALNTYNKLKDNIPDMYNATGAGKGSIKVGSYMPSSSGSSMFSSDSIVGGALDTISNLANSELFLKIDRAFGEMMSRIESGKKYSPDKSTESQKSDSVTTDKDTKVKDLLDKAADIKSFADGGVVGPKEIEVPSFEDISESKEIALRRLNHRPSKLRRLISNPMKLAESGTSFSELNPRSIGSFKPVYPINTITTNASNRVRVKSLAEGGIVDQTKGTGNKTNQVAGVFGSYNNSGNVTNNYYGSGGSSGDYTGDHNDPNRLGVLPMDGPLANFYESNGGTVGAISSIHNRYI